MTSVVIGFTTQTSRCGYGSPVSKPLPQHAAPSDSLFDILDAWELLRDDPPIDSLSLGDWQRVAEAVHSLPETPGALGSIHLGLTDGTQVVEGGKPVAMLAPYAVAFDTVWLPDPIYSFLGREASKALELLPDLGGTFFTSRGITNSWRTLNMTPPSERKNRIREFFPPVLARLRELRPLVEAGAVRLARWEPLLFERRDELRTLVTSLADEKAIVDLTQRFPQINYNYGVRVGAIGITAAAGGTGDFPAAGTPMYWADKRPMVLGSLLNASFSTKHNASFAPALSGDRVLYDCLVSGGHVNPMPRPLGQTFSFPKFADALLPDLVAIRKDSATLEIFRKVMRDAAGAPEDAALPELRDRLQAAAAKVAEDASLKKVVGGMTNDFVVGSLASGLGGYVLGGVPGAIGLASVTAGIGYLAKLLRPIVSKDRRDAAARAELIVRVSDRM